MFKVVHFDHEAWNMFQERNNIVGYGNYSNRPCGLISNLGFIFLVERDLFFENSRVLKYAAVIENKFCIHIAFILRNLVSYLIYFGFILRILVSYLIDVSCVKHLSRFCRFHGRGGPTLLQTKQKIHTAKSE